MSRTEPKLSGTCRQASARVSSKNFDTSACSKKSACLCCVLHRTLLDPNSFVLECSWSFVSTLQWVLHLPDTNCREYADKSLVVLRQCVKREGPLYTQLFDTALCCVSREAVAVRGSELQPVRGASGGIEARGDGVPGSRDRNRRGVADRVAHLERNQGTVRVSTHTHTHTQTHTHTHGQFFHKTY